LQDAESEARGSVAAAPGCYPEHAAMPAPALEDALVVEADEETRKALRESLQRLRKTQE